MSNVNDSLIALIRKEAAESPAETEYERGNNAGLRRAIALIKEHLSRGLPSGVDTEASGLTFATDEAQAETPQGVSWSLPCEGITGDLDPAPIEPVSLDKIYHNEEFLRLVCGHDNTYANLKEIARVILESANVKFKE